MSGREVLVVSGEPLWPSVHGGRIRTARIAAELGKRLPVRVLAPEDGDPEADVAFSRLPPALPLRPFAAAVNAKPRMGQLLLDARRREALERSIGRNRPRAVLFAQSYLAAMVLGSETAAVVDFSDVEVRRMASLARQGTLRSRAVHGLEALKARRWEPAVAGRAALCTTPSQADAALLSDWGAAAVLVPHGADAAPPPSPSPDAGPVTFVASFGYGPNREAASFLLGQVWPRLRRAEPSLRLRLVGREAERWVGRQAAEAGVEVVSDPPSTEPFYREASLVVAPVEAGGGAQVKVSEALARGRVVVATPYSAASVPGEIGRGLVVAHGRDGMASAVLGMWREVDERHRREALVRAGRSVPTWEEACAPLVEALVGLPSRV